MRRVRPRFSVFLSDNPSDVEMTRFYCADLPNLTAEAAAAEAHLIGQRLAALFERRSWGTVFVEPNSGQAVTELAWLHERLRRLQARHPRVA